MEKIAFITDIHLDDQFPKDVGVDAKNNWKKILNDIHSRNINAIIYGGDIGQASAHPYFFDSLKEFKLSIILGNHDHFQEVESYFKPNLTFDKDELYYSSEADGFKFIFLDSSSHEISSLQLEWLKDQLVTEKRVLLFVHHPVLPVKTVVDTMYPLKNREDVKKILLQSNKKITVVCGHYHMVDDCQEENIHQLLTCAASCQIDKNAQTLELHNDFFGYRLLLLSDSKLETELITF